MWLFSKVKKFIQTHFTFSVLNHRKQIGKQRTQLLNTQQKLWVYFSITPLFIFFEKIKSRNSYTEQKCRNSVVLKLSTTIPERIERKNVQKDLNQNDYSLFVPYSLINKKKRSHLFFFHTN